MEKARADRFEGMLEDSRAERDAECERLQQNIDSLKEQLDVSVGRIVRSSPPPFFCLRRGGEETSVRKKSVKVFFFGLHKRRACVCYPSRLERGKSDDIAKKCRNSSV